MAERQLLTAAALLENTQPEFRGWEWDDVHRVCHARLVTWKGGHKGCIVSVGYTPDGKRVVTAGDDMRVRVRDAGTGTEVFALKGHSDGVNSAAFSPDGKWVVTASQDKTARVWDAITGAEIAIVKANIDGSSPPLFRTDGSQVVVFT